ncbi:MAG: YdcF family protein [Actinomycetota bacterium]|nr:YdcF family protein [Actinomycetota bacterium]
MRPLKVAIAVVVVLLAYPLYLAYQVWSQSHRDENHSADAIVVLGAAQYDGEPSPIFKARLDQAAYLYREGFSTTVIVTGGKQEGDRFTEAEAGANYLVSQGVSSEAFLLENQGSTTLESLREVRDLADEHGIESVLLVSDPMHSERIKRIAGDLGFSAVYSSPASYISLNRSRATKARELAREVASIIAYEIFGQ